MNGRYCVILPAFNAAKTIGQIIDGVKTHGLSVIVVDDGSSDQTAAIAAQHGALVISHLRNRGKGGALRTGFEHALRAGYDGIITMDSDGQHDPNEIQRIIYAGERQHAGMVLGDRMSNGDSMPREREWTNKMMSRLISLVANQRIPDTQCGYRFIRKEVLEAIPLRTEHFEIETELVLEAALRRWKIVSVPVRTIYQDQHTSHIRPVLDGLRFLRVMLRHLIWR